MRVKPRILIVDSDQNTRHTLTMLLASEEYDFQFMENEQNTLSYLEKVYPDVILVDTGIPDLDGFELCRRIKEQQQWWHIPIILMIAPNNEEDLIRGLDAGVDDFLKKPVSGIELKTRVRSMIRLKSQYDELQSASGSENKSKDINYDKQMLRGFTHEVSNMVTSNMLILATAMKDEVTLCHKNAEYLSTLFDLIESDISEEKRDTVLDYFQKLEKNEQTLDKGLRLLTRSIDRAVEVTRLVLEYSRLGRFTVAKEPLRLQYMLETIVQEHQGKFAEQHISVRLTGSAEGVIYCHKPHLHSIFTNLVLNACQAFADLEEDRERVLEITLNEKEDQQIVIIRDNATGISEEHLHQIFEPFYTTRPKASLGLGLSFVSKLVSMYHGTVEVESKPGQGAAFTLTFPIQKFDSPPGNACPDPSPSSGLKAVVGVGSKYLERLLCNFPMSLQVSLCILPITSL
jgi:signal transduction histidine kinase